MTYINSRLTAFAILLILINASCDDEPLFSSPEEKLAGDYEIKYATENGSDQMYKYQSLNISLYHFDLEENPIYGQKYWVQLSDLTIHNSYWAFENDHSEIDMGILGCFVPPDYKPLPFKPFPGYISNGICSGVEPIWKITKLTKRDFWIETTFNGNDYVIHFKEK